VQAEVDPLFGLGSIALAAALGAIALISPNPIVAPIVLVGTTLIVIAFPGVRALLHKRALGQIDIDLMERAYESLKERPDNIGAKLRIAKSLHARGSVDQ